MKRLVGILLSLCLLSGAFSLTAVAANADTVTPESAAATLYEQGLFKGVGKTEEGTRDFDLDRAPNRAEAITMLVRLLGKEQAALTGSWKTPFTDVPAWAEPYVGYAYANGLTKGKSANSFGGSDQVTAAEYLTFALRALGYQSGKDFDAAAPWKLSDSLGLTNGAYHERTASFTRGDFAVVSLAVHQAQSPLSAFWSEGSNPAAELREYVAAVTKEGSSSYIPVEDRIAVFDLDGTLMCETYPRCFEYMVFVDYALNNPSYTPTDDIRAVAQEILDTRWQEKPSGISTRQAAAAAVAYQGMTPAELEAYVQRFMDSDAEGFTGLKRGEAFYAPMVELVDYLEDNGFAIYIVTATERNIVRALVKDTLGIPPARVIGTEYGYTATGQGDAADGDYTFQATDKVVFDGNYYGENAKMSKVDAIVREIGQQPVLAFGNSSGDVAMCKYVVTDNPYSSRSYIVLADDEAREWGDAESANKRIAEYTALGIGTISMRDDFAEIYGSGVEKDTLAPTR